MPDKRSVQFDSNVDVIGSAGYLEGLAQGLRDGGILVESGDKSLTLHVPSEVTLEFEAACNRKKGKSSIEIGLKWRVVRSAAAPPATPTLVITGGAEPAQREEPRTPEFTIPK